MARSRNIKPGFFLNDELAEIEPLGRLLFAGLWTMADREGRLEYRSKKIKAEILPYDGCDAVLLLRALEEKEFIFMYEADGVSYIEITNWHKHQNPHHMEAPSEIPAPSGGINKYNHNPVTKNQRERIFKRDVGRCSLCGKRENLSIDHIIPVSKGGSSDDSNLRTLCMDCNNKKGNREQIVNESWTNTAQVVNESSTNADSLNLIPDSLCIEEFFKTIWSLYPNKKGVGQVSKSKKVELYKVGLSEITNCINSYKKHVEAQRKTGFDLKYQNGSTFFNSGYKDYLTSSQLDKPIRPPLTIIVEDRD